MTFFHILPWFLNLAGLVFLRYMIDDEMRFNAEMREKYGENEFNITPKWYPAASAILGGLIGVLAVFDALLLWAYFSLQN